MGPDDASIEAAELGNPVLIAHAEIYAIYDQYLTDHKLIDYARMIQFAVKAFQTDAKVVRNTSDNLSIF